MNTVTNFCRSTVEIILTSCIMTLNGNSNSEKQEAGFSPVHHGHSPIHYQKHLLKALPHEGNVYHQRSQTSRPCPLITATIVQKPKVPHRQIQEEGFSHTYQVLDLT